MLRKLFSNTTALVVIAITTAFLFAILSCHTEKWHWFGRSGALITMIGVILSARPLIRMGYREWRKNLNIDDAGWVADPPPEQVEKEKQKEMDINALHIGMILSVIGTLIWAYGDLIGGLP